MKILIVNSTRQKYGGNVYEKMVAEILSDSFETESLNVGIKNGSKFKYFKAPLVFWRLFRINKRKDLDFVIKDFEASLFLNKKPVRNIAIIHHIDNSCSPILLRITYPFLGKIVFHNLKRFDAIITVSKYWETYLKKKGYKNIYTIYNAFDLDEFNFSSEEIEKFKERYGLTEKPIIYIGNCRKEKGVIEVYRILKDLDAFLVTSGKPRVKIPAINLQIEYRDYLRLLKASSIVITMSKFKEGWCRTAHEAMLCRVPVIGSGMGGMKELLKGGKQIICSDFNLLKEKVENLLEDEALREKIGNNGYNFAKDFTIERFEKNWLELLGKLL